MQEDRSYPFFVFRAQDDALVGGATLSRIHRGSAQSCTLGYWVGAPFKRRGFTRSAVRALLPFAFVGLTLASWALRPPSRTLFLAATPTAEPSQFRAALRNSAPHPG